MLTLLLNALRARIAEWHDRMTLRALLEKDDRTLCDIGLTRPDIESALNKPIGIGARHEARRLSERSLGLDRAR